MSEEREIHEGESVYAAYQSKLASDCKVFSEGYLQKFIDGVLAGEYSSFDQFLQDYEDSVSNIVDDAEELSWYDFACIMENCTEYSDEQVVGAENHLIASKVTAVNAYTADLTKVIAEHVMQSLEDVRTEIKHRISALQREEEIEEDLDKLDSITSSLSELAFKSGNLQDAMEAVEAV